MAFLKIFKFVVKFNTTFYEKVLLKKITSGLPNIFVVFANNFSCKYCPTKELMSISSFSLKDPMDFVKQISMFIGIDFFYIRL